MEPRFTRGEYWLLETVAEHEFEVCALIESDLESFLGKRGHGLTRDALVETLHRLLSSGLIYAKSEMKGSISTKEHIELALEERVSWDTHHVFISADGDVELAPDESKPPRIEPVDVRKITYYGLTQEGGAQWEAFAAPDWQKYIAGGSQPDESEYEVWELICGDKNWRGADKDWPEPVQNWLEEYIESMCFYSQMEVILESVEWDYVTPWQATYWKQLDGGDRVRFRCRDKSGAENFKPIPSFPDMGYFDRLWCAWR
ncbi:hypothetical protein C6496_22890 [Candidatus Poribacteria bacterium]|nr:MAG: hypothetical protein C6496_22890 [Candidatus Poribacteria bacterium]